MESGWNREWEWAREKGKWKKEEKDKEKKNDYSQSSRDQLASSCPSSGNS